jgi:hypothetical protein
MKPKADSYTPRGDLTAYVQEYMETEGDFIAQQVMPPISQSDESGTYGVIPIEVFLTLDERDVRPLYGHYNVKDSEYEVGRYYTYDRGLAARIDKLEIARNQDIMPSFDLEASKVKWRTMDLMRGYEKRVADLVMDSVNFTNQADAEELWTDTDACVPFDDINTGIAVMRDDKLGMEPDAAIMDASNFDLLKNSAQFVSRVQYTYPGLDIRNITPDQAARAVGLKKILIGKAKYAVGGVLTPIWDKTMVALVKISDDPMLVLPGVGRTHVWNKVSTSLTPTVESTYMGQNKTFWYNISWHEGENLIKSYDEDGNVVSNIADNCVYLITAVQS